jgi:hypothetical protein
VTVGILGTVFAVAMLIDSMTERNPAPPAPRRKPRRRRKASRRTRSV